MKTWLTIAALTLRAGNQKMNLIDNGYWEMVGTVLKKPDFSSVSSVVAQGLREEQRATWALIKRHDTTLAKMLLDAKDFRKNGGPMIGSVTIISGFE